MHNEQKKSLPTTTQININDSSYLVISHGNLVTLANSYSSLIKDNL